MPVDALGLAYSAEMKRTRNAVALQLRHHWNNLPDYRDGQIPGFLDKALPVVAAGQRRAVALSNAYYSRKLGTQPLALDVARLVGAPVRGGIEPAEVYARPFKDVWTSIEKIGFAAAVLKGLDRLLSTGEMDVIMSARDTAVAYGQAADGRVAGWERVADPGCCDFCQMIDGAKVGSEDPAPLHNFCSCWVEPIDASDGGSFGDALAPGDTVDQVAIQEHGELGPVITDKDYNFTGPDDLN